MTTINAAFLDSDIEELRQTLAAVNDILANTRTIEATVTERVGTAQAPDLSPLADLLGGAQQLLRAGLDEREAQAPAPAATPNTDSQEAGPSPVPGTERGASPVHLTGEVSSREDVVRMLDQICQYYASYEPSSPVPMLLQRARRLVTKDFLEIIRDLAPAAMEKIEEIRGPESEET